MQRDGATRTFGSVVRHVRNRSLVLSFVVTFVVCRHSPPSFAQPVAQPITQEAVNDSIDRAVSYLERQQKRGHWSSTHDGRYPGGATALCALALLNAGAAPDDPAIRDALDVLRGMGKPNNTYVASLQTMVFSLAAPKKDRGLIRRNAQWLQEIQLKRGTDRGGWTYGDSQRQQPADNSNSQFALLALHEAARVGIDVQRDVWKNAFEYWAKRQKTDGSWPYRVQGASLGSMTSAGISSLVIASKSLSKGDAWLANGKVLCCGLHSNDDGIQRGLEWLGRSFTVKSNPGAGTRHLSYYLYGLERVGRLSAQRFIGAHDWYREGAEHLVQTQNLSGSWGVTRGANSNEAIDTAFGVLFLAKGRRPVLIAKLKRNRLKDWNRHRNDVANLTEYVETRWNKRLTWQVTDLHAADLSDLRQAPILFLSGRDDLTLNAADKTKLYEYINQGGFVFAENCCNGTKFDQQFRQLMAELFPSNPLRLLPPDHPVWYAEQPVHPNYVESFPLHGVDACCRTSVVYCPRDLGCFWELARRGNQHYSDEVTAEMNSALAIGANVAAYATNRQVRDRLDVPTVITDTPDSGPFGRGKLYVAKLDHSGGSDEAPAALANLLGVVKQQLNIRVDQQRRLIHPTDPSLPDFPLAFVHGRRSFRWSAKERQTLREFIENGGVLFGDAICASADFDAAFRKEIAAILPQHPLQRIPPNHPIFSRQFKGYDVSSVNLRTPGVRVQKDDPLTARLEKVTPRLDGIEIDGRYVVIFSPYDLSCALESHQSLDCKGYTASDAAKIGVNIILYALHL